MQIFMIGFFLGYLVGLVIRFAFGVVGVVIQLLLAVFRGALRLLAIAIRRLRRSRRSVNQATPRPMPRRRPLPADASITALIADFTNPSASSGRSPRAGGHWSVLDHRPSVN